MEKIVEKAEQFNFKGFLVSMGILGLLVLSQLIEFFSHMSDMKVGFFFKSLGAIVATLIIGAVALTTLHMLLWYLCDQYRKVTGTSAMAPAGSAPSSPAPKAEEKKEEDKKEE